MAPRARLSVAYDHWRRKRSICSQVKRRTWSTSAPGSGFVS
ncbi:hypothetical protein [Streptomyces bauhiniae]